MPYYWFLPYNAAGGIVWVQVLSLSDFWPEIYAAVAGAIGRDVAAVVLVLALVALVVWRIRKHRTGSGRPAGLVSSLYSSAMAMRRPVIRDGAISMYTDLRVVSHGRMGSRAAVVSSSGVESSRAVPLSTTLLTECSDLPSVSRATEPLAAVATSLLPSTVRIRMRPSWTRKLTR